MQSLPNAGSPSAHSVHWLSQLSQHSPLHLYLVCRRAPKGRAEDLFLKLMHREFDNETINNAHDGSACLELSRVVKDVCLRILFFQCVVLFHPLFLSK